MADFTPITSQEQFDSMIKDRLAQAARKYEGYTSPADLEKIKAEYDKQITALNTSAEANAKKYSQYDKELADRDAKIKGYETSSLKTRIAHEEGLAFEFSSRLSGETEDDIRADAKALAKLIGNQKGYTAPSFKSEKDSESVDPAKAALKQLSESLKR